MNSNASPTRFVGQESMSQSDSMSNPMSNPMLNRMSTPAPLRPGDAIAILSPATEIKSEYIDGAIAELKRRGYEPIEMPFTQGHEYGTFAATDRERLADLKAAIENPRVKAILCGRGGYGCVHLLSRELQESVSRNPKWIIGFSDISALHALWQKAGVQSVHSSMAKQLTLHPLDSLTDGIFMLMEKPEEEVRYTTPALEGSIEGEAEGKLVGGNLAVLNGLAATPWDILSPDYLRGKVLFLEDVGEKIYQVERMLKRLQLAGSLDAAAGIVFGRFTDYNADRNFPSMEKMISERLKEWGIKCPVVLGFPIGHIDDNFPVTEGRRVRLIIKDAEAKLTLL